MTREENAALDLQVIEHDLRQSERMIGRAHDFLGRFVSYPSKEAHDAHALWILHAHLMDHWDSTPRLAFLSAEPGSGKTRALEATALLVPNAVQAVNMSPAALFRLVGDRENSPTILYDEVDTLFNKSRDAAAEEIRGLLNAGHRKGQATYRCVMNGKRAEVEKIEAYSAVALAGLGWLPQTLLDRSIIVRMRKRHPGEQVEQFRARLHEPQGFAIRDEIATWAQSVDRFEWPTLPDEIKDRAADCWEPLLVVADLIGGRWPARARAAGVALLRAGEDAGPSLGVMLLSDIKTIFEGHHRDALTSKELIQKLIAIEESPWGDLKGKPLDERGLARRLRPYNIRSDSVYVGTATNPKGYKREWFQDSWDRYLTSSAPSATSATSATVVEFQGVNIADIAESNSSRNIGNPHKTGTIADIAEIADFQGKAEIGSRHKCVHCGSRGETTIIAVDGMQARVHEGCVDGWLAGYRDRCGES